MRLKLIFFFFLPSVLFAQDLDKTAESYFDRVPWVEDMCLASPSIAEPFSLTEETLLQYTRSIQEDSVYPTLKGLGTLNYSAVPYDILQFLQELAHAFKNKELSAPLYYQKRSFLPFFFAYTVNTWSAVTHVFFDPPQMDDADHFLVHFKILTDSDKVNLATIEAFFFEDKWQILSLTFNEDA